MNKYCEEVHISEEDIKFYLDDFHSLIPKSSKKELLKQIELCFVHLIKSSIMYERINSSKNLCEEYEQTKSKLKKINDFIEKIMDTIISLLEEYFDYHKWYSNFNFDTDYWYQLQFPFFFNKKDTREYYCFINMVNKLQDIYSTKIISIHHCGGVTINFYTCGGY